MPDPAIRAALDRVDEDRLRTDLFHLSSDPLPFRKLNYTAPGRARSSLDEADDYLASRLGEAAWASEREPVPVQAFRCDARKPKAHQYSTPSPEDPWYTAHNLWARRSGASRPEEIILLCAHKDSQSWVDSPGAHDNATGTSALLEMARVLADEALQRSVWLLFCNEEHTPWTSVTAAEGCRRRDDDGSFVNAGYASAIMNGGGGAGTYPYYHREDDIPEHVDVDSVRRLTQVTLAAVLSLDRS